VSDDFSQITVTGQAQDLIVLTASDTADGQCSAYLKANGAYAKVREADFSNDEAPLCGWQVMTNKTSMTGFTGSYAWRRAPGKNTATEVQLAEGVSCRSDRGAYYFFFPSYGMNTTVDVSMEVAAQQGDVALLSYVLGGSPAVDFDEGSRLLLSTTATDSLICFEMPDRNSFMLYQQLQQYRPLSGSAAVVVPHTGGAESALFYSLQGVPTLTPKRGLYIRNGKKTIVK
jgi:hypothetical protein